MNEVIQDRIKTFRSQGVKDDRQILRELIQEVVLLGLWRAKFFEHAAFYGGTALRILYKLDRFSEDLDFTLLNPDPNFKLDPYLKAVGQELNAYNFEADVSRVDKKTQSDVESAFVKAGTRIHLLKIGSATKVDRTEKIQVKFEVDINPALGFSTTAEQFFWPQTFSVLTCDLPSLFAGKLHATFCRQRIKNVKGRDWYDLFWYLGRGVRPNYAYLEAKLRQSGHWSKDESFSPAAFKIWARQQVEGVDVGAAKKDVERFISSPNRLDGWNLDAFLAAVDRIPQ